MAATLKLKQVKSANGSSRKTRESLKTLGLGRIGKSSERPADNPTVRGLVRSVEHLIEVDDG
ncbi:MAG TPA: 50S ribosomal protein L30 [Thermoleophilaceae bacterium]|jgi:large subunit ribosomal protein L30